MIKYQAEHQIKKVKEKNKEKKSIADINPLAENGVFCHRENPQCSDQSAHHYENRPLPVVLKHQPQYGFVLMDVELTKDHLKLITEKLAVTHSLLGFNKR